VGNIDFKVISATENSHKFQKTRFWKEKSVKDVDEFTLGSTAQATLVCMILYQGVRFFGTSSWCNIKAISNN
jgi:hypothetical protein